MPEGDSINTEASWLGLLARLDIDVEGGIEVDFCVGTETSRRDIFFFLSSFRIEALDFVEDPDVNLGLGVNFKDLDFWAGTDGGARVSEVSKGG